MNEASDSELDVYRCRLLKDEIDSQIVIRVENGLTSMIRCADLGSSKNRRKRS